MVGKREKECLQFLEPLFQHFINEGIIRPNESWDQFQARSEDRKLGTDCWQMNLNGHHFHAIHLWQIGFPPQNDNPHLYEIHYDIEYKVSDTEYRRFEGYIYFGPNGSNYIPICNKTLWANCYVKGVKTKYIHFIGRRTGVLDRVPTTKALAKRVASSS